MTLRKAVLLSSILLPMLAQASDRIIGGIMVPKSKFREVVKVDSDGAICSGTAVGPRVVVLAAHCVKDTEKSKVFVGKEVYYGTAIRSPLYPGKDHDVAVVVTEKKMKGITPAFIGGAAAEKGEIFALGFGCTQTGGGGGNDGILRMGQAAVKGVKEFDFIAEGAALCFGDSGGPAFLVDQEKFNLVGIGSKGDINKTSYFARLDSAESKSFLETVAKEHDVTICGISSSCGF